LSVNLDQENVPWLEQHVVDWFTETVSNAVIEEFNQFIQAGDAQKTKQRIEQLEKTLADSGGFLGMGL
jgi:hypothetical protein